jgi:hypothetical protein
LWALLSGLCRDLGLSDVFNMALPGRAWAAVGRLAITNVALDAGDRICENP